MTGAGKGLNLIHPRRRYFEAGRRGVVDFAGRSMQAAMSARLRLLEASHGRRDARDRRLATWPRPFFEGLRHSVLIVSAHMPSALVGTREQSAQS